MRDSTGAVQNPPYNVVSSDGRTSKPLTILYNCRLFWPDCGPNTQFYTEATALFAFTASDVWICAGSVHHLKGAGWEEFAGNGAGSATKIWGSSQSDMYFVGYNGTIVHSDGNTWQRLQSGTATPINDVWGVTNPASGKEEVYCAVSDIFQFKDRKILKLVDGKIDSIAWDAQRDVVLNLWTHQGFPFYVGGGSGLYENKTNTWQKVDFGTNVYPSSVRGTSLNNIIVVGSFGLVAHYNGVDWKILTTDVPDAAYSAVAVKGNMAAAVGSKNGRAILTIGRQQ
ncbi:MAG: hypothetical protein HY033_00305 [Ignavibacteriae bacterium]|nr:hypothetical protein [Ignavibacteriota bacterium]